MNHCSQILLVLQDVLLDQGLHLISFSPKPDYHQIIRETARTTNINSSSGRTCGIMHITCRKDTTQRTLTADPFFSNDQHLNLFSMLRVLELHQTANIMIRGHCILAAYAVKIGTYYCSQGMKMQQHSTILILVYWRKQWTFHRFWHPIFRVILIYIIYSIRMESERSIHHRNIPSIIFTFLFLTGWCYWLDL